MVPTRGTKVVGKIRPYLGLSSGQKLENMLCMTTSDVILLAAWRQRRDEAAFQALCERHAGLVGSVCRRLRSPDVDEAAQAVFVILAERPGSVGDATRLAGWLVGTTRRVVAHQQRARSRRHRHEQEAAMEQVTSAASGPAPAWEDARGLLDEALARLSPARREAVIRYYLQGRSQAEVASELGCTTDAVKTRVHEGLAGLRTFFARRGVALAVAAVASGLATEATAREPDLAIRCAQAGLSPNHAAAATTLAHGITRAMTLKTSLLAGAACITAGSCLTAALLVGGEQNPPPPAPTVWPREGIALGGTVAGGGLTPLSWNPRGDAIMVRGSTGLMLVGPGGVRQLGTLGHETARDAWNFGAWIDDGRWLSCGRGRTGLNVVDGGGEHEVVPRGEDKVTFIRSSDLKNALVIRYATKPAETAGRVLSAWVVASGNPNALPVILPMAGESHIASIDWGQTAGVLVASIIPESERAVIRQLQHPRILRSSDLGADWTPVEGADQPGPPHGQRTLGEMQSALTADSSAWTLPGGGRVAVVPDLPRLPITTTEKALATPPATGVVVTDTQGVRKNRPWPAASGDRPWPVAMLADGSLVVARHHRMIVKEGTWSPDIETWAILDPAGTVVPLDLPWGRLSSEQWQFLLEARDHSFLVIGHGRNSQPLLYLARPGQRNNVYQDLYPALGLAGDWEMESQRTQAGGPLLRSLAILTRPETGPRQLLVWNGSTTPTLIHSAQGADDAVVAVAWDTSGRHLAWVQGGRLRVWSVGDPGLPLPGSGAGTGLSPRSDF